MASIIGKKIGMTRVFRDNGIVIPVTVISAEPMTVIQKKTKDKEGYDAVQFGSGTVKRLGKSRAGHLKKANTSSRILKEFHLDDLSEDAKNAEIGTAINVSIFKPGDMVKVSGITKGRGFQGAVKRHGFHGMPASHGHHHVLRHVGSIGQRFPQHTLPGMRMAGHMGNERFTVRGLEVITVDIEKNMIAVKGAVPGRKGTVLEIRTI